MKRASPAALRSLVLALAVSASADAATITVTATTDDVAINANCTLREAVLAANSDTPVDACTAGSGSDTIQLAAGTYTLSIAGAAEDAALTGDLDLTGQLEITGAGPTSTFLDGGAIDRVVDVRPGSNVTLRELAVTNGFLASGGPTYHGGGIASSSSILLLDHCSVENNRANYGGGGLWQSDGVATVVDTTFTGNRCNFGTGSLGCAILSEAFGATAAELLLERSTVAANRNQSGIGAAILFNSHGLGYMLGLIRNSTIAYNVGESPPATSAAIYATDDPGGGTGRTIVDLSNVTITRNSDIGVWAFSNVANDARIDVRNSIVAENDTYDCEGYVHSRQYNVIGDAVPPFNTDQRVCNFGIAEHDRIVADPLLDSLADNGGLTATAKLLDGSPARDAGNPSTPGSSADACLVSDQRGVDRFVCDAGAYDDGLPTACAEAAGESCRLANQATFQFRDDGGYGRSERDKITWKWREPTTVTGEFGDPTFETGYSVCVYDGSGSSLVAVASIAPAGTCNGDDCWRATGSGYKLKDLSLAQDGVRSMSLKADDEPGRASVKLVASGANLQFTGLSLTPDVRVQLVRTDSGDCWESVHSAATIRKNTDESFKSKMP